MNRYLNFLALALLFLLSACATEKPNGNASIDEKITFVDGPDGMRMTLPDSFLFDWNQAGLKSNSDKIFTDLEPILQKSRGKIKVEGHTDPTGVEKLNKVLSEKRAIAVKEKLVERKIAASRIEIFGYGSDKLLVKNAKNAEENASNRRAVVLFVGETRESLGVTPVEKRISETVNKFFKSVANIFGG